MPRESLPPQAYTKETLANAITWLQTQPEHVKSLVRNQDSLITIYLKWKRNGAAALESLSSSYNERLRSDLKSIRAVMDQFDPNAPVPARAPASSVLTEPLNSLASSHPVEFLPTPSAKSLSSSSPNLTDAVGSLLTKPPTISATSATPPQPLQTQAFRQTFALSSNLDDESQKRVDLVRTRLNLSTTDEALRLLISLGFDRIKDQLPRGE
jgi:hypothetical protein